MRLEHVDWEKQKVSIFYGCFILKERDKILLLHSEKKTHETHLHLFE